MRAQLTARGALDQLLNFDPVILLGIVAVNGPCSR